MQLRNAITDAPTQEKSAWQHTCFVEENLDEGEFSPQTATGKVVLCPKPKISPCPRLGSSRGLQMPCGTHRKWQEGFIRTPGQRHPYYTPKPFTPPTTHHPPLHPHPVHCHYGNRSFWLQVLGDRGLRVRSWWEDTWKVVMCVYVCVWLSNYPHFPSPLIHI